MARLRPGLFIILTLTLVATALYPIYQDRLLPEAHATSFNLSLIATANGWNSTQPSGKNPTITVLETDNVNIALSASDSQQHQFYVDVDGNSLPDCYSRDVCSQVFNMTNPTNYGWLSGIVPVGTYRYYDSYNQATTNGTFIVQPGPYPANADFFLTATTNGWNYSRPSGVNPTITVYDVQNVVIRLDTTDPPGTQHQFYIDFDKNGVPDCSAQDMCSPTFDSTVLAAVSWIGGSAADGTYHYYDSYYQAVSNGTIIIRPYTPTPDYSVSASPSTLTIQQGRSQTSIIGVTSRNNFTGIVSLTANPTGVTATLNPTSVSPPKNGIATSTLNVTAPASLTPGNYQVVVTGSNGTTQRSTTVNVQVVAPDFTITANTNTLNLIQGSSTTATITVTSQNGFSGTISLKTQVTPNGPTASLSPPTLNIASGGSQTTTLTVTTTPTTPTGSYTITITGNTTTTNGPLTHTATITLNVNPPTKTNPSNPLAPTFLFEILAIIILAVATAIVIARHRAARGKSQTFTDPTGQMSP